MPAFWINRSLSENDGQLAMSHHDDSSSDFDSALVGSELLLSTEDGGDELSAATASTEWSMDEDALERLVAESITPTSDIPVGCSTPDSKKTKINTDSGDSTKIKRPMNAFMLWSQVL